MRELFFFGFVEIGFSKNPGKLVFLGCLGFWVLAVFGGNFFFSFFIYGNSFKCFVFVVLAFVASLESPPKNAAAEFAPGTGVSIWGSNEGLGGLGVQIVLPASVPHAREVERLDLESYTFRGLRRQFHRVSGAAPALPAGSGARRTRSVQASEVARTLHEAACNADCRCLLRHNIGCHQSSRIP